MAASCSLAFRIARTDFSFIDRTIPHLVRACNFEFTDRFAVVDAAPLVGDFRQRPGVGTLEETLACCDRFIAEGILDRVVLTEDDPAVRQQVYRKHFGRDLQYARDFRGSPILGSLIPLEEARTDYLVYFDSDMLLHQSPGYSWIEAGMQLLQNHEDIAVVTPLSGPPTSDGQLKQRGVPYQRDRERGIYTFKEFTNHKFLIDCDRFARLLPIQPRWVSWKRRLASPILRKSALLSWEAMFSQHLQSSPYIRAEIDSSQAWTLHTLDRGEKFIQCLPQTIAKVEAGNFPAEQAGDYDLQFKYWLD